jgi:hypothetical protein
MTASYPRREFVEPAGASPVAMTWLASSLAAAVIDGVIERGAEQGTPSEPAAAS